MYYLKWHGQTRQRKRKHRPWNNTSQIAPNPSYHEIQHNEVILGHFLYFLIFCEGFLQCWKRQDHFEIHLKCCLSICAWAPHWPETGTHCSCLCWFTFLRTHLRALSLLLGDFFAYGSTTSGYENGSSLLLFMKPVVSMNTMCCLDKSALFLEKSC